jgi:hypothetical protein
MGERWECTTLELDMHMKARTMPVALAQVPVTLTLSSKERERSKGLGEIAWKTICGYASWKILDTEAWWVISQT